MLSLLSLLSSLLFLALPAQAQEVRATTEADSVYVGERFEVRVTARGPGEAVLFPPPGSEIGDLNVLNVVPLGDSAAVLTVAVFALDSAVVSVPAGFVQAEGDTTLVFSNPVRLHVRALVSPQDETIRDLRDLAPMPRTGFWWWPYALAALVLLAALIAFWLWWRKQHPAVEPGPEVPALTLYENIMHRLQALETADVRHPEQVKAYFVELTDALRVYLAATLGVHALEQTSRELLQALKLRMPPPLFADLRTILQAGDLVKFADQHPPEARCRALLSRTQRFVQQLEALVHPPPVEEPAEASAP